MITENKILMDNAREALRGRWGTAIVTFVVYFLITGALGAIKGVGPIISILITGPLMLGWAKFSLSIARNEEASFNQLFGGFQNFMKPFVTYLIMIILVILWMLLLIVPGIIAAISYSQVFFIMNEDETIDGMNALNKSKQMMYGYKLKYFYLSLRFLLWGILCLFTLGIGFLWLVPWIQVTLANFYDDIKNQPVLPTN
jgi:uncharacterized membrane protein